MRRRLVWVTAITALAGVIWLFMTRTRDASLDLGDRNADVVEAYVRASAEAFEWHGSAFVSSMSVISSVNGKEALEVYFYGKSPFQRHMDVLDVVVELKSGRVLSTSEGKGGWEPNYDTARPMRVSLRSGWREVLHLADSAYGMSFKSRYNDARSMVTIENDRWYVNYVSDSAGFRVSMTVFDSNSHGSIANTVQINDSVRFKSTGRNTLPG